MRPAIVSIMMWFASCRLHDRRNMLIAWLGECGLVIHNMRTTRSGYADPITHSRQSHNQHIPISCSTNHIMVCGLCDARYWIAREWSMTHQSHYSWYTDCTINASNIIDELCMMDQKMHHGMIPIVVHVGIVWSMDCITCNGWIIVPIMTGDWITWSWVYGLCINHGVWIACDLYDWRSAAYVNCDVLIVCDHVNHIDRHDRHNRWYIPITSPQEYQRSLWIRDCIHNLQVRERCNLMPVLSHYREHKLYNLVDPWAYNNNGNDGTIMIHWIASCTAII